LSPGFEPEELCCAAAVSGTPVIILVEVN